MIIEKCFDDIGMLMRELNAFPNHFVFRGQSNSEWSLHSSLERLLGDKWGEKARKFEDYSLSIFKSKFHIYSGSEHKPNSKLCWLSIMQHYGVPTRMIDFTTSPYIAIYFALEDYDPLLKKDLSIFCLDYSALMEESIRHIKSRDSQFLESRETIAAKSDAIFENVVDRYSYDIAWVTEPLELNARIDRQSGTFLMSGNSERMIGTILDMDIYKRVPMYKFSISSNLYEGLFVALRKMSINSKMIYGDLGGLAKSIRMDFHAYGKL